MKVLAMSLALALAVVVGLLWTHSGSVAAPVPPQPQPERTVEVGPILAPVLASATAPSLKPDDDTYPERRQLQEGVLKHLRKFATEAKLTEEQWQRFERDLMDLAAAESAAYIAADRAMDFTGTKQLNRELGLELVARCGDYMTADQLSVLRRYRPWSLVMQVRQMFVPQPLPGV